MKISKQRKRRIRNLVISSGLMAMLFSISTYAWFIGMRTVNVSSFDIEIASTESLLLSLDGAKWDTTVSISKETLDEVSYEGHTNSWGGSGLKPVSSVGEMDDESSRMILFEKGSVTATPGGYRLLASRIDNSGQEEKEGYVAFDLFIKNSSGSQYIKELNELDEEGIYLSTDSFVDVASSGVAGTGIENSVRVAFAQVGRVDSKNSTTEEITSITCETNDVVTGICRKAQIWEPNDTKHVQGAINWFNKSCRMRTGEDVRDVKSFGDSCEPLVDGIYYPTYAVAQEIKSEDNVDVYDGLEYNGYTKTSSLEKYPYFTDTDKLIAGTARPEFMYLAPNSVTKVRIYIFIEGQDVDNYDFASIGRKITVKFGFTKDRLNPEDIDYDGPIIDDEAPEIFLLGDNPLTLQIGDEYVEPGYSARDNRDADITERVEIYSDVNVEESGTYTVTYEVSDRVGNRTVVERTVIVE